MFSNIKQRLRRQRLSRHGIIPEVDIPTVGYGARTGIWVVHPDVLSDKPVVYSFGVGDNVDWDLAMIKGHGAELHAFDPTPRSVAWVEKQHLPPGFVFHAVGLAAVDGEMEFTSPVKDHKINYSSYKSRRDSASVSCAVKRFVTLASELGHSRVDVVKMDIEGGEMDVLPDLLDSGVGVGQLLVEFHYNYPSIGFDRFLACMDELHKAGFGIFHISDRGYEISLIHRSLC